MAELNMVAFGVLCQQKYQVSRKENCPRKKLNASSFLVHILSSEQVTGKQDHVDICCLALCKHTLEDDLYVSRNFLLLSLWDDCLHCPLLYVNSQVSMLWMDLKMENIWNFLGTFRSCEELRMFFNWQTF